MDKEMRTLIMWIVIAILVIAVAYFLFFQGGASDSTLTKAGTSAGQVASSSGMVGGC